MVSNILDHRFDATEPNAVWAADITYVWILEGWLYLAVVMDLYSRQIVDWVAYKRIKRQLTLDALTMACWRRKTDPACFTIPIVAANTPVMKTRGD